MEKIEEHLAYLSRTVEDLSDVVARQQSEITRLQSRVHLLLRREAEREANEGVAVISGDERPPHW